MSDPCSSPAALRNRDPIREVLSEWLPATGLVLEVASGTGEHATYFARSFPGLDWQPSDLHAGAVAAIGERTRAKKLPNLRGPVILDCTGDEWPVTQAAAILAVNMVHISPWEASLGLLSASSRLLAPGAPLILYGPWIERNVQTATSNLAFDSSLRERNPEWGLRHVDCFGQEAEARGLSLAERRAMPANNIMLLYRRRS